MQELKRIHYELIEKAKQEAFKLWRLARKARKHGVSESTIQAIRDEADYCYRTLTAYPERMIAWDFEYKMKYAFKGGI